MEEAGSASRRGFPRFSLATLSLLIASLSLAASISQSYNYRRNIESVQQNVLRAENLKTCRDIIEIFFALRLKAEEAQMRVGDAATQRREMKSLVYRFGAYGTYLANFAPEKTRASYTALSWQLNEIAEKAGEWNTSEFAAKYQTADEAFGKLNEDCAKSAQFVQL